MIHLGAANKTVLRRAIVDTRSRRSNALPQCITCARRAVGVAMSAHSCSFTTLRESRIGKGQLFADLNTELRPRKLSREIDTVDAQ